MHNTKVVGFRLPLEEAAQVRALAKSKNKTVAAWLREDLFPIAFPTIFPAQKVWKIDTKGFTYIIGDERNRVKIGWSYKPHQRLAALQRASADTLTVLLVLKGNSERQLHLQFVSDRIHPNREWFHLSDAIRIFIAERQ